MADLPNTKGEWIAGIAGVITTSTLLFHSLPFPNSSSSKEESYNSDYKVISPDKPPKRRVGQPYLEINFKQKKILENILEEDKLYTSISNLWVPHAKQIENDFSRTISNASSIYNVPKDIYLGVVAVEQGKPHNFYASGIATTSPTGAESVSQLLPLATKDSWRFTKNNPEYSSSILDDVRKEEIPRHCINNTRCNITAGIAYLRFLYEEKAGENWSVAIQMYNNGPARVGKAIHYHRAREENKWWPPIYKDGRLIPENLENYLDKNPDWNILNVYSTNSDKLVRKPAEKDYYVMVMNVIRNL